MLMLLQNSIHLNNTLIYSIGVTTINKLVAMAIYVVKQAYGHMI